MDHKIYTIPNLLSLIRLLLLIPIVHYMLKDAPMTAFYLCLASILTDNLDGYLARKLNQTSDLGRIMDPVIDKVSILFISGCMVFSSLYDFPSWFFYFILIREAAVVIGGSLVLRKKDIVMEARRSGKLSAFAMGLAILIYIPQWQPYATTLVWTAFIMTLYSTYDYGRAFYVQIQR